MKKSFITLLLTIMAVNIMAQMVNPVHFKSELKTTEGKAEGEIVFSATIDAGWHVYSTDLGEDGPIEATFNAVKMEGVETVGKLTPKGNVIKKFDNMFGMELKYFENTATFVQKVKFTKPEYTIDCFLEYGACNDQSCLPPSQVDFKENGKVKSEVLGTAVSKDNMKEKEETVTDQKENVATDTLANDTLTTDTVTASTLSEMSGEPDLWQPVIDELRAENGNGNVASNSLLYLLLMGFVGGLLAVCMPCIWPIIPMTVSFFLKRAKTDKGRGIRDAVTYGLSIIVIYLGLGLLVTAISGSDTLNAMSTNAISNIFLFLLLMVFALSFF